jgi:hypothetical protein
MSPFATLAIAACKRAIAAVKDWGAPCGFINKNPCSRRKHVQSSSAAPQLRLCQSVKRSDCQKNPLRFFETLPDHQPNE